jgi:hypothetical protein
MASSVWQAGPMVQMILARRRDPFGKGADGSVSSAFLAVGRLRAFMNGLCLLISEQLIVTAYDFISVTKGSEQSDGIYSKVLSAGHQE